MVRLISRQRGGLAAVRLTKLFRIDDFSAAKDFGEVLIIIIYSYLIIIIIRRCLGEILVIETLIINIILLLKTSLFI